MATLEFVCFSSSVTTSPYVFIVGKKLRGELDAPRGSGSEKLDTHRQSTVRELRLRRFYRS
jgi:hypothetical protein